MRAAGSVRCASSLGIDRKTIRKYLAPALAEGLAGARKAFDEEVGGADRALVPELVDPAARALTWPQIAAHHQWIADQLKVPVTVATIAQRLRDDHRVEVSESTVRRYIATTFAEERLEGKVTVPRGAVEPAVKPRSTTAGWACGGTRPRDAGSRCGCSR